MGARRDDLVEVALVDGTGPEGSPPEGPDASRQPPHRRRPWSPRRRRAFAAAALALVMGTVAVRFDAAAMRQARLAHVPGLAVSLAVPLRALWQLDGRILGWSQDGATVLLSTDDAIEAVDATSGAALWRRAGAASWCELSAPAQAPGAGTATGAGSGREVALCTATDSPVLEVLDLATGDLVTTITPDWPQWSSVLVDGGVVVAGVDEDGHVVAERWQIPTGERAWTSVGPVVGDRYQGVSVFTDGSGVTAQWSGGSITLDPETGARRSGAEAAGDSRLDYRVTLADGSQVIQDWSADGDAPDLPRVRVLRPDGSVLVAVPGLLLRSFGNAGAVSEPVLVQDWLGNGIGGYDPISGAEVWSSEVSPSMLVDGHLVGRNPAGDLMALDARTGELLWTEASAASDGAWGEVSDGLRLLSLEGPDLRLVARSLDTGRALWSLDQSWVGAAGTDGAGAHETGPVTVATLPSGLVVLSGARRTAVLGS